MGVFDTIKALQDKVESAKSGGGRRFLALKSGQSCRIRFRQELAKDGRFYDDDRGVAHVVGVHAHPGNFRYKTVCTAEDPDFDFRCWGCEQVIKNNRWKARQHLLINVATMGLETESWESRILDQTFNQRHIIPSLLEYAGEYGTILSHDFKFSRTGAGMSDTNYTLIPLDQREEPKEVASLSLLELDNVYSRINYQEQVEFFAEAKQENSSGKLEDALRLS